MNIFKKIFGSNLVKSIRQPFSGALGSMFGSVYQGGSRSSDYVSEYKNWVYACATVRAEDVANIKLKLMRGDVEVTSHPIIDLLNKVNPGMTQYDLFNATQTYKDLDGNCFWFLARDEKSNGEGEVREIYILKPDRVKIVTDKTNPLLIIGYVYISTDGTKVPLVPSEIIHHKNFNPKNNYPFPGRGMGVVEAAYLAIYTDNQMREYNATFFKNSARPDGMLIPSGDSAMSPEEYTRLKDQWNEEHKGGSNAHKIAVVTGGLKYEPISSNQVDMQFIDQKRFNRDEILAMFRVPKTLLGITEDVNRANADAAIYVFSLKTITPLMRSLVDTINEFLVPAFGDDKLKFTFVSPVPDDREATRADYTAGIDKWYTRNEIRAKLGLEPSKGGDQFFGTASTLPLDSVPTKKKTPKKLDKPTDQKTIGDVLVNKFISKSRFTLTKGVKEVEAEKKVEYVKLWKSTLDALEGPLKKKLQGYFEKQKTEVLRNVQNELKGLEVKEFKYKGVTDMIFDEDEAVESGIKLITPFIAEYIRRSGTQAILLAGGGEFDIDTPKIRDFIPSRAKYFAETITQTTADSLIDSIQEGIDAGETIEEISARVAEIYDKAMDYRTDMIARTEISASANFGSVEAYLQAGVEKHQWIVVDPEDRDCLMNEGEIVKINEAFPDGSILPPDPHPNCQCTTIPVFEDQQE